MQIEFRVTLLWSPPDISEVANDFLAEAESLVNTLTGLNEGEYEQTSSEVVDYGIMDSGQELTTTFEIALEYERVEGKFASKEELAEQIEEELLSMGDVDAGGITWAVDGVEVIDRKAEAKAAKAALKGEK